MEEVTLLLEQLRAGEPGSEDRLVEAVYDELRRMAAGKMAQEAPNTLQATALVNEAYLRLGGRQDWQNRKHFFGAASQAMRRVLIDRARARQRAKRGGGKVPEEFMEELHGVDANDEQLLKVHEVLDLLENEDLLKAEIVKLRFFVGLTNDEIASAYNLNEKTVRRHWSVAKVRLFQLIQEAEDS